MSYDRQECLRYVTEHHGLASKIILTKLIVLSLSDHQSKWQKTMSWISSSFVWEGQSNTDKRWTHSGVTEISVGKFHHWKAGARFLAVLCSVLWTPSSPKQDANWKPSLLPARADYWWHRIKKMKSVQPIHGCYFVRQCKGADLHRTWCWLQLPFGWLAYFLQADKEAVRNSKS